MEENRAMPDATPDAVAADAVTFEGIISGDYVTLVARLDALDDVIADAYDKMTEDPSTVEQFGELCHQADLLTCHLSDIQPWTVFATCTGSAVVWVEAGYDTAYKAFEVSMRPSDPYDYCDQCGSSSWSDVSDSFDLAAGPNSGVERIDAVEVANLLGQS